MLAAQAETVIKCPECGRQAYPDLPNFEEKAEGIYRIWTLAATNE